jgi:hypothetical protein
LTHIDNLEIENFNTTFVVAKNLKTKKINSLLLPLHNFLANLSSLPHQQLINQ